MALLCQLRLIESESGLRVLFGVVSLFDTLLGAGVLGRQQFLLPHRFKVIARQIRLGRFDRRFRLLYQARCTTFC